MFDLIIKVTMGVVFAFCAVMLYCLLPVDKLFSRKGRKDKDER